VGVAKASRYIQGSSELAVVSFICSVRIKLSKVGIEIHSRLFGIGCGEFYLLCEDKTQRGELTFMFYAQASGWADVFLFVIC